MTDLKTHPLAGAQARGFTIREATPSDLPAAQAHIIRVLDEDLDGYKPAASPDIVDLKAWYLDRPRNTLLVAVDSATGEVIGTTGVREDGPRTPPHPRSIAERYASSAVAQLCRVYIARGQRRRGVARALVDAARRFIASVGGYETIYFHTHEEWPGALDFWRAMPTREVHDGRYGEPNEAKAIHFELAMP